MKSATKNLLTVFESAEEEVRLLPSRTMFSRHSWRTIVMVMATLILGACSVRAEEALKGIVGEEVEIPCVTTSEECGSIHGVRWYHNNVRVYAYGAIHGKGSPEGPLLPDRAHFKANDTPPVLQISSVKLGDEGTYRCDVTYVSLTSTCPASKSTELNTFVKPESPQIYMELPDGEVIGGSGTAVTGTIIGPFHENEMVTLRCISSGGKPAAKVTWLHGSQVLAGYETKESQGDGTEMATNEYRFKASRSILLDRYDCEVTHDTLDGGAMVTWVEIDVHVPPSDLLMEGDLEAEEGAEMSLKCTAIDARPAAKITWFNGSEPLSEPSALTRQKQEDNTFRSSSTLIFTASKFDDEETIWCEASNEALEGGRGSPLKKQAQLTVYYAPVVRLSSPGAATDQVELIEGATLRLECAFEANPAANVSDVTWYRNGQVFRKSSGEDESGDVEGGGFDANKGNDNEDGKQQGSDSTDKDGRFHLVLGEINRRHTGEYACSVTNNVGTGRAENNVNVSILYPPKVRMVMEPTTAVEYVTNVTLTCEVEEANPSVVQRVRWLRDSQLFEENGEMTIVLVEVNRTYHRNYSCQAENKVGWGQEAEPVLLDVTYTPGKARITHRPPLIIKGQPVTFMCELDDPGNPPATEFTWKLGDMLVNNIKTYNWSRQTAELSTANAQYICQARNAAGEGAEARAKIEVNAAPSFITALPPSIGALETAKDISLTCQVECEPRCSIDWFKNGELLTVDRSKGGDVHSEDTAEDEEGNAGDDVLRTVLFEDEEDILQRPYSVKVSYLSPNERTLQFSSVVSTLRWNLSSWSNRRLDRTLDVANYTCRSSPNLAGIGVNSTTLFHVEYPPENISLSNHKIEIEEGQNVPFPITCRADGNPELSYIWTFEDKPVSGTNELKLDFPVLRDRTGDFTCIASNPHGNVSAKFTLDVLYKPDCELYSSPPRDDLSTMLTCTVKANPEDVDFTWSKINETIRDNIRTGGLVSVLQVSVGGTYFCTVNNSIGSDSCSIDLPGPVAVVGVVDNRILIIIVVVAAIIVSIIICVAIILLLKRRGSMGKSSKAPRNPAGPPGEGDKAFYENLPFHGLQPAPNKPFKPLIPDLEYADVDFSSANQGQPPPPQQLPPVKEEQQLEDDVTPDVPEQPEQPEQPERPPRANKNVVNNNHA